ncbi:MAG: ATP-binding protein [Candidatus Micrarchaeota archaeon]
MFINREKEKAQINNLITKKGFEFAVFYGRRRVGKTRLILECIREKKHIYYLAVEKDNIRYFVSKVSQTFPEVKNFKEDWEVIIDFLKDKIDILVIDEFQNLAKEDKNLLSIFQRIVDTSLKNSNLKFFVLGSSISLISSYVLSEPSPLYGRKTFSSKIIPLEFFHLSEFFPKSDFIELACIYGFADGMPYYLEKIKTPFWQWLDKELKFPTFVKDELNFMIKYEFEEVGTYKLILEAIANGKATTGEIKDFAKLQRTDVSFYLSKLLETEFIERRVPLTEREKSKLGRYFIKDQFIAFWFKFIQPNLSSIEEGIFSSKNIEKQYPQYMGFVFEKICKQLLVKMIKENQFTYDKIGNWWHKDVEIDLIAINEEEKEALFIECKWEDDVNAQSILELLKEKTKHFEWNNKVRKEKFAIFARSFKNKEGIGEDVLLFDIEDMGKRLK